MSKTRELISSTAAPRRLRLEWIEAGSLAENPGNWRRHPEQQAAAMKGVLDDPEIGWAGACLYNERTSRLIDGHARRNAVDPATPIPVLVGDWSEEAERKILLTLDPLGMLATADSAALAALMKEVDALPDVLATMLDAFVTPGPEPEAELRPLPVTKPPEMTWVLIGVPTVRFGSIAALVDQVAAAPGTVVETVSNDG